MTLMRIVTIVAIAVFVVWTNAPSFAQTTPPAPAKQTDAAKAPGVSKPADVKPATPGTTATDTKDEKKVAKKTGKKQHAKKADQDNDRGNKGGETRGLDRADKMAGEHGQQGRDNARARQGR